MVFQYYIILVVLSVQAEQWSHCL